MLTLNFKKNIYEEIILKGVALKQHKRGCLSGAEQFGVQILTHIDKLWSIMSVENTHPSDITIPAKRRIGCVPQKRKTSKIKNQV